VKHKPVIPREQADLDVDDAVACYLREGAAQVALGFVAALEQAYARIGRFPGAGSPCYGHELHLPGLRRWPLAGYPHLILYLERADSVDVWRVLHGQRDIPVWMQEPTA
jgi:toxin ParE1/3/4